jgi:hypothetical protein
VGILDHHALHVYISPPELESADWFSQKQVWKFDQ